MPDAPPSLEPSPAAADIVNTTGFTGTVVVLNRNAGRWTAGDAELAMQPFIPASTFKIFSSLVAVETGVAPPHADGLVPWDGRASSRPVIDRNLSLREAFRLSAVPHYQAMVREIGARRMQAFIDEAGYGNGDLSGGIDQFWLTGGLRIAPVEQIAFLQRLHRGELPFSAQTMATVRDIMSVEVGDDYRIRAKTGWAVTDRDLNTGWWVGQVEKSDNVWFFASLLQSREPDDSFGAARLAVARRTLESMGVLG
ncbi:MAG: penicillin-binding transpeptidase domain-containing protein [Pseudohongiellaceae bacterium]